MRKLLAVSALVLCLGARSPKLSKDEQVIHALNRLTFGPRPGDVEAVRKMGVKKWIDLQLHPERIAENPELAQRLAPLESLRLSQAETERNYPNPQMIRRDCGGAAAHARGSGDARGCRARRPAFQSEEGRCG